MGFDGCGMIAFGKVLISLIGIEVGPESGIYLGVNRFFNYFIKVIELLAALFYFYLHREFQTFSKIPNYRAFIEGSV